MRPLVVLLIDLVCVVAFASIGRGAHAEAVGIAQVAGTAWPFLLGCLAGWAVPWVWRRPLDLRTGTVLMVITVPLGHAIRVLSGGRTHWTFVVVSIVALSVLMLGWRLVAKLVATRRSGVTAS